MLAHRARSPHAGGGRLSIGGEVGMAALHVEADAAAQQTWPEFPPGLWRRIELHPRPGAVVGGLEDDVHRFELRLAHRDGVIRRVEAAALRFPWSACPGAAPHLKETLQGRRLDDVARCGSREECTHLYDLAVLCAAYVDRAGPLRFDMKVADRVEERTTATLEVNGMRTLVWPLAGTRIDGEGPFAGRDLRAFSAWRGELAPDVARQASMLRRAVFVSGARRQPERMENLALVAGAGRMGVCYRYQPSRAFDAVQSPAWRRDFSRSGETPLAGFDPDPASPPPITDGEGN